MQSQRFLALARTLVDGVAVSAPLCGGGGEVECRSAISRAYYAAYNVAVDFLDQIGFETTNVHNCHQAVQYALNQSGNDSLRVVANHLGTLHTERKKADYELRNPRAESARQAEAMVRLAEETVDAINQVWAGATSEAKGAIAVAVLNYVQTSKTSALRRKSNSR